MSQPALAASGIERMLASVAMFADAAKIPSLETIKARCRDDVLCAGKMLAERFGPKARLERVVHPDTDRIRRVKSALSVTGAELLASGAMRLELSHFGRKAVSEIMEVVKRKGRQAGGNIQYLQIDLRHNRGGNLNRMLRVAALFLGKVPDAVRLQSPQASQMLSVPDYTMPLKFSQIKILIGPDTASAAEIFTALLRVHAGAIIAGSKSYGKDYLLRTIALNQNWQLLVPAEKLFVPGTSLEGGIVPDVVFP